MRTPEAGFAGRGTQTGEALLYGKRDAVTGRPEPSLAGLRVSLHQDTQARATATPPRLCGLPWSKRGELRNHGSRVVQGVLWGLQTLFSFTGLPFPTALSLNSLTVCGFCGS